MVIWNSPSTFSRFVNKLMASFAKIEMNIIDKKIKMKHFKNNIKTVTLQ